MALHLNAYISCFAPFSQDVPHLQRLRQEKLSMSVLAMGADHSRAAEMGEPSGAGCNAWTQCRHRRLGTLVA